MKKLTLVIEVPDVLEGEEWWLKEKLETAQPFYGIVIKEIHEGDVTVKSQTGDENQ